MTTLADTAFDHARLPKISVVTPNYNYGHFLEATLRSVLDQGYAALEYIVLDAGSTDRSVSIIERYADRLAYWQSGPDEGQYQSITDGLNRATGEVLGWINSDDMHMPWTLKAIGSIFATFPEIDWVSTLRPALWDYSGVCHHVGEMGGFSREAFLDGIYAGPYAFIQQESTFWRRSLWQRAGGYVSHLYGPAGDFDLWRRFYEHADLVGVCIPLAGFRIQDRQQTSNISQYIECCQRSLTVARTRSGWQGPRLARRTARAVGLRSPPRVRAWAANTLGYVGKRIARVRVGSPDPGWSPVITHRFL